MWDVGYEEDIVGEEENYKKSVVGDVLNVGLSCVCFGCGEVFF